MSKNSVFLFSLTSFLIIPVLSIFIPLNGRIPRCMIVYSVGQSETVKLDINFPQIPSQMNDEFYEISWKNTQNSELAFQTVKSGRFKKQLSLVQNVIYDLCIRAQSVRDYGIVLVQYSANNLFSVNTAQVKVPQNLLKSEDITSSYLNAQTISKNLDAFIKVQEDKAVTHQGIFTQTNKISQRLVQISIAELVIIIGAGIFQFWCLLKYLKDKNYI